MHLLLSVLGVAAVQNTEKIQMLQVARRPERDALSGASFLSASCGEGHTYAQHGWPRFSSELALQSSPWGRYFELVYGRVPQTSYPICTYNLAFVYPSLLKEAGIDVEVQKCSADLPAEPCPRNLTGPGNDGGAIECVKRGVIYEVSAYSGASIFNAMHFQAAPSNTWVEVVHKGVSRELNWLWMYRATGSGVWYNIGETKVFKNHKEAKNWVSPIKEKGTLIEQFPKIYLKALGLGFTSLQFRRHADRDCGVRFGAEPGQANPKMDRNWAIEVVDLTSIGVYPCGGQNGKEASRDLFRAGWEASRRCRCNNDAPANEKGQIALNCEGSGTGDTLATVSGEVARMPLVE